MKTPVKQSFLALVEWPAVGLAAIVSGTAFLLTTVMFVPLGTGGNSWVVLRILSSALTGPGALNPPDTFSLIALITGPLSAFLLAGLLSCVIAIITHRWGLITGMIIGTLTGLAFYVLIITGLTLWLPWLIVLKHNAFLAAFLLTGMISGATYELFDSHDEPLFKGEPS